MKCLHLPFTRESTMLALNIRFAYFGSLANWLVCIFGVSVHRKTSGCHPICYDIFFFFFDNPDNCDLSLNSFFFVSSNYSYCMLLPECIWMHRKMQANCSQSPKSRVEQSNEAKKRSFWQTMCSFFFILKFGRFFPYVKT